MTGGAGFIGSRIVDALVTEGRSRWSSSMICRRATRAGGGRARASSRSASQTRRAHRVFDEAGPDRDLPSGGTVERHGVGDRSGRDGAVNVDGTLNVLRGRQGHGAPVVFTSTGGALYGNEAPIPTPEDRIPAPFSPYGASKWAGEAYLPTWSAASGIPNAVCRLGNVYGPRQSPHGEAGVVAIFTTALGPARRP